MRFSSVLFLASILVFSPTSGADPHLKSVPEKMAVEDPAKKPKKKKKQRRKRSKKSALTPADYAQWERLDPGSRTLSSDGKWLAYGVTRVDRKKVLHLHRLGGKRNKKIESFEQGSRPVFSKDSSWLAVTIEKDPPKPGEKKKSPSGASTIHLRNLKSGETTEFKDVRSFTFSGDSKFLAIEVTGKSGNKALVVRNLDSQIDTTFGNITQHHWSDQGSHLAMVVDSPSIGNSLQIFTPNTGILLTLDSHEQDYKSLKWREDSLDLAAMREMKHSEKEDVSHTLLAWKNVGKKNPTKTVYQHSKDESFPEKMYAPSGRLTWSKDGTALYLDLKEWDKQPKHLQPKEEKNPKEDSKKKEKPGKEEAKKEAPKKSEADQKKEKTLRETLDGKSNVEVWHTKDVDIMPLQKKRASSLKNPGRRAVWWIEEGKIIQLANELTESVRITRDGKSAIGTDRTPHEVTAMFGPRLQDVYEIDTQTGEREKILDGVKYVLSTSPDGRHLIYLRDGKLWSWNLESDQKNPLNKNLKTSFANEEDDTLAVEKRPYGQGFWLKDSSAFLMYDRYDIWLIKPDGSSARRLTDGRKKKIRHRLSQATFAKKDKGLIDPKKPLYLALYGDRTKKSGYALLPDLKKKNSPKILIWDDKMVMSLTRAEEAETFLYTVEDARDSPDLFVAGPGLKKPKQVSKTNPFQKKFHWGHTELIDFENEHGVKLQGSLRYPANYRPGKKYPMVVYIYEKRSQGLHRYETPSEKHPYNPAVFSSEGYFVFQPDIVYRPQEPGVSALECVVPAVKKVIKSGMIDKEKIGLVGHSWGAYQTAFIVTRSDLFAAGVAGAPLTNMMSMSVSVYWNSGQTNAAIFTQSQGRMDKPFWRDPETYIRNSPIHGLDTLNTPLLITFGDKDGAVDWGQGVQMYNAARWANKDDLVMLVYPGENHGLREEGNMVDYHYRVREWFDTHVKGNEAPKWITEGKSFLEKQKEKENKSPE